MQTKHFVELDANGAVMNQVTRTAEDWSMPLPASWIEVTEQESGSAILRHTRAADGTWEPPAKVQAKPDPILAALEEIKAAVEAKTPTPDPALPASPPQVAEILKKPAKKGRR